MEHITVGPVKIGNDLPFVLIAGPCALESRDHAFEVCARLVTMTKDLNIGFIFKTSFDKANRTSIEGQRGLGMTKGLPILAEIREKFGCPVVTDVHESHHCAPVAEAVDILQIPAYLCRQTDLLAAAAATNKVVHIKKGQFLAPWDMKNVLNKTLSFGNRRILLCERGVSFGYNTLISDMRALPIMVQTQFPVIFDATHSVQQPGGAGTKSGGQREFVPVLSRAALSVGVAGLYIETHPDPDKAPSDGPNMVYLHHLPGLLKTFKAFDELAKANPIELLTGKDTEQ